MAVEVVDVSDVYVLNQCARHLARDSQDSRHDFGQVDGADPSARICEAWRFPVIDSLRAVDAEAPHAPMNRVTFVYRVLPDHDPSSVLVVGTFGNLFDPVPLRRIRFGDEDTPYFAVCVAVPVGEIHCYRFIVDGVAQVDPINPQRVTLDNGRVWSRFFTQFCSRPLSFEEWEYALLERLVRHILPFRTREGQNFLERHYFFLDRQARDAVMPYAYRLDESVGASNYIDCILAREEAHHAVDYRICLAEVDRLLRQRYPSNEPHELPVGAYATLYDEMSQGDRGNVPGWDYGRYENPQYFWRLLRRHAYTGAFAHPKYGGNVGAAGWAYLAERYAEAGSPPQSLFNWRRALEQPLGASALYHG